MKQNKSGGAAHSRTDRETLITFAMTSTNASTGFVADPLGQLATAAGKVDSEFLAKLAVYAVEKGKMRDVPPQLLALLSSRTDPESKRLTKLAAPRILRSGKDIRNFASAIRNGKLGRKSLGTLPRTLVRNWFDSKSVDDLLRNSIGNKPTLADVIRLAHVNPGKDADRVEFFRYLMGHGYDKTKIGGEARKYIDLLDLTGLEVPRLPIEFLLNMSLDVSQWREALVHLSPLAITRNLMGFARKDLFSDQLFTQIVANRLATAQDVSPIAMLSAIQQMEADENFAYNVGLIQASATLNKVVEQQFASLPRLPIKGVAVCTDTSGSMRNPLTGHRGGGTTSVTCSRMAAIIGTMMLRSQEETLILPFDTRVHPVTMSEGAGLNEVINALDHHGGGTNCDCAIEHLNATEAKHELVVIVSDNESWAGMNPRYGSTGTQQAWKRYLKRVPGARLVLIDLQPTDTTQAGSEKTVLNVAGWTEESVQLMAAWIEAGTVPVKGKQESTQVQAVLDIVL